ncbi:MAG: ribosome maturation factor RimM, partial [Xanthobacteraceae bacterium]
MAAGRICVAEIGGAHGIGGEVKLKSFTADPMALKGYSPLESEDGTTRFAIEALRPGKSHLIAQLRGILDRSAAERLAGVKLFVPRACLPPVATDEFYHADLVGLRAITAEGAEIGTVMAVHDFGAGAILELQLAQSDATLMLPFT